MNLLRSIKLIGLLAVAVLSSSLHSAAHLVPTRSKIYPKQVDHIAAHVDESPLLRDLKKHDLTITTTYLPRHHYDSTYGGEGDAIVVRIRDSNNESPIRNDYDIDYDNDMAYLKIIYYYTYNSTSDINDITITHLEMDLLWVNKQLRYPAGLNVGSRLMKTATALADLFEVDLCWKAQPFNLHEGQSWEELLPYLVRFYERHGGKIVELNTWSAHMCYYHKPKINLGFPEPDYVDVPTNVKNIRPILRQAQDDSADRNMGASGTRRA